MQADTKVKGSRLKLRNAFFDCLKERALADITVKEICEKTELNRVTFYRNYKNLNDIVTEVENERLDQLRTLLASGEKRGEDLIREAITMLYEAKEIDVYEGVENLFKDFKTKAIQISNQYVLDDWIKLLPKEDRLDAELGLEMFISGALHVIANSRDKYTCEDIIRNILEFREFSINRHS